MSFRVTARPRSARAPPRPADAHGWLRRPCAWLGSHGFRSCGNRSRSGLTVSASLPTLEKPDTSYPILVVSAHSGKTDVARFPLRRVLLSVSDADARAGPSWQPP